MTAITKPAVKPANPRFSSGPCAKRPGWTPDALKDAALGQSHRAKLGKGKLKEAIDKTRALLQVPDDYRIGIVPASDTGAVEMALWSLLGPLPVDMVAWESFGLTWVSDVIKQLKLDARIFKAEYGALPDLSKVDFSHDVVFTWNGTTSGVRLPNADWIPAERKGLAICDATSAAYAQRLDFAKLDVVTFSWQKALGGEAAHGMIILSPKAVERLESYTPAWPMPKIFRMTKNGKLMEEIFEGSTINTPSLLCTEDYLDALNWGLEIGGLDALIARADASFKAVSDWVETSSWAAFLAEKPETRSNTSVCLKIIDPVISALEPKKKAAFVKAVAARLVAEEAGLDLASYRDAPSGFRIWCGATVEASDVAAVLPWLDWAFAEEKAALSQDA